MRQGYVRACMLVNVCVFLACSGTHTGLATPPSPSSAQARLINGVVSVRSALSGVQWTSHSEKVTAGQARPGAKPSIPR